MTTGRTTPSDHPTVETADDADGIVGRDHRRDDWLTPDGQPVDRPTHVLAHLSDTHLTSAGIRYNGVIDADAALDRAVAVLRAAVADGRRIDAVVVSGDLTDSGDPDAYHRLEAALGRVTVTLTVDGPAGIPLIFATGNHDVRRQFHRHLLRLGGTDDTDGPILQVRAVRGLRIIVLDSTIPGHGHGRLLPEHLDELRDELRTPAAAGTVVVLHHAPLPPPLPGRTSG